MMEFSMTEKGQPLPRTIGACADLYAETRALRLRMDKEVAKVKERETEIREYIINTLSSGADTGASGKLYRAQLVVKSSYKAENWLELWQYVKEHDRFDIYQKRLNEKAIEELIDDGVNVPGVVKFTYNDISVLKV